MSWFRRLFGRGATRNEEFGPEPEEALSKRGAWVPMQRGPNSPMEWDRKLQRARCRELVEKNPHAASAVQGIVNTIVGAGIVPRPKTTSERADKQISTLLHSWADEPVDVEGTDSFWGLQQLIHYSWFVGADSFLIRVPARSNDGLEVPIMLRALEAEMLVESLTTKLNTGGRIVNGVELDARGRRVAFHFYREHPNEGGSHGDIIRVPASDVAHFFWRHRAGAQRGVLWLSPVIMKLRDLDDFDEAEVVRKKIEACFVISVTSDTPNAAAATVGPTVVDSKGKRVEMIEPGLFVYGRNGAQVKSIAPAPVAGADAWRKSSLHTIAAGARTPYALMTGDLSQVNYSSGRIGLTQFYRTMETLQWGRSIPELNKVMRWWVDAAYAAGKIRQPKVPFLWTPPPFLSANPMEDEKLALSKVRSGRATLADTTAELGFDPKDVWRRRAEELKAMDEISDEVGLKKPLVFDTDSRNAMGVGGAGAAAYEKDPPAEPTS